MASPRSPLAAMAPATAPPFNDKTAAPSAAARRPASATARSTATAPPATSARPVVCTPLKALGNTCSGADQCNGGHCVDGVCCASACDGQCEACDVAGSKGQCIAVNGAPRTARTSCVSDGSICGGMCNGLDHAACVFPDKAISCRAESCTSGVASAASVCDGAGACPVAEKNSCDGFGCNANVCALTCQNDSACASGESLLSRPMLDASEDDGGQVPRSRRASAS